MAYNTPRSLQVFQSTLIDLTTIGNYNIFTTTSDFIVTNIFINSISVEGTISGASINIGWTPSSYNDIVNGIFLFPSDDMYINIPIQTFANLTPVPSSTTLVFQVVTADSTATTETQIAYIHGFYV